MTQCPPQRDHVQIRSQATEYIYHPSFSLPQTEDRLWGPDRPIIEIEPYSLEAAAEGATRKISKPLRAEEERTMFLRYNYARYRLAKAMKAKVRRNSKIIQKWHRRGIQTRERLIHANLPLVPSMARKKVIPGVEFREMVAEGYMAVLRSIEKFDVSRGFKFSTYACRSILSSFYRLAGKAQTRRKHVPAYYDSEMEKSDYAEQRHEQQNSWARYAVRTALSKNLADLTDTEFRIIQERFPLTQSRKPLTLRQLGKSIGISEERVRQIEQASLSKLRVALHDFSVG